MGCDLLQNNNSTLLLRMFGKSVLFKCCLRLFGVQQKQRSGAHSYAPTGDTVHQRWKQYKHELLLGLEHRLHLDINGMGARSTSPIVRTLSEVYGHQSEVPNTPLLYYLGMD